MARFFLHERPQTDKQAKPRGPEEFIEIPIGTDVIVRPATDKDREQYRSAYESFKGQELLDTKKVKVEVPPEAVPPSKLTATIAQVKKALTKKQKE